MKTRVVETNEGIQNAFDVEAYDSMQRRLRDRGWMETRDVIASGISCGHVLEVGPGPGYLGLEWLKSTSESRLTAVEISPNMLVLAGRNAERYGLNDRVEYVEGNAMEMPFEDGVFDGAFTNGSLHEWERPEAVFSEIRRVVKPGGRYFISDLRRDILPLVRLMLKLATKPAAMREGLISSLNAAYTAEEIRDILAGSPLSGGVVSTNFVGLEISGMVESA
jgi:ubiquinone/menaquinone biosynthesis C-methylase UbiE